MTTLESLRALAEREFDLEVTTVDPDTALTALGVDSLSLADFIFKVEDHFDVRIEMEKLDPLLTLAGFAQRVDEELAKKASTSATEA